VFKTVNSKCISSDRLYGYLEDKRLEPITNLVGGLSPPAPPGSPRIAEISRKRVNAPNWRGLSTYAPILRQMQVLLEGAILDLCLWPQKRFPERRPQWLETRFEDDNWRSAHLVLRRDDSGGSGRPLMAF